MKFENILVVCKDNLSENAKAVLEDVKGMLKEKSMFTINYEQLQREHVYGRDLVITFGGDGTFVKAASMIIDETPIVGINSDPGVSEGFLASISGDNLKKLGEILLGNYKLLNRNRARIIRNGIVLEMYALNEVYIGAMHQFHSSRYSIEHCGRKEEHRSSGVVVSTGTGSTAWFKTMGGEPFSADEDKLKFIVREPYFGKVFRPKILKGEVEKGKRIIFESKRNQGGILAVDFNTYDFNFGDVVEIELSDKPLKVIVVK